jgi:alkylation response protein AidB-like acyl-CoA dehydrogenase
LFIAKTDSEAGKDGITAFLTSSDVPCYRTESINNKLGIRAADTAEIALNYLHVSVENVVGTRTEGFHQLMAFFPARADVGARAIGVSQVALDKARAYANEREQFGQKISEF